MTLLLWMAGISIFAGCIVSGFVWYGIDLVALLQKAQGKRDAAPAAEAAAEEASPPEDEMI